MKLSALVTVNAITWVIMGIALGLYAPLALNIFGVPDIPSDDPLMYWNIAAFARLYGSALFGLGLILWALRGFIDTLAETARRGMVFSLLFANLLGAFVAATQSAAFWQTISGWLLMTIYLGFTIAYGVSLRNQS